MRWNCPHCEELVTAGIDFENTKKAYVRCAKCNGMALIHRSAVLADYVKARRLEEEAQLEAELRVAAMEIQVRGMAERLNAKVAAAVKPPPPNAQMAMHAGMNVDMDSDLESDMAGMMSMGPDMDREMIREAIEMSAEMVPGLSSMSASPATPMNSPMITMPPPAPTYAPSEEAVEGATVASALLSNDTDMLFGEISRNDLAAVPPVFTYAKPPAFLMRTSAAAIETLERDFATDDGIAAPTGSDSAPTNLRAKIAPTIALWVAAALAVASGIYLYVEGRKALAPSAISQADEIRSKANSAVRAEERMLVLIRVPRAILRNGPGLEASLVQTLDRASVANLLEEKDGWMKIQSPKISSGDRTAWIRSDLVTRMPN